MSKTFLDADYSVNLRFSRSARIDADLGKDEGLEGYSFNDSAWEILRQVGEQYRTGQRAFTWTGPYGAGKSSLVLFLAALLGADNKVSTQAVAKVGLDREQLLSNCFGGLDKKWIVVPVVGSRDAPDTLVADAIQKAIKKRWKSRRPKALDGVENADTVVDGLLALAEVATKNAGGLLLVFDEMGKALEGLAESGNDIHFFQEIAESFQRAEANCLFVGVLHQSFQEYASQIGRLAQNEWAKVQGRFTDIPFSVSQEDVVSLVGQAISGPRPSEFAKDLCAQVSEHLEHPRYRGLSKLDKKLANCWPLHPISALMLGPLSRSRFGQNERSTFSFLCSVEPGGFRAFLREARAEETASFRPHQLWDYLQLNMEPVILASKDGHKWANAIEAIERARKTQASLAEEITKLIALLEIFGRRYGLVTTNALVSDAFCGEAKRRVSGCLKQLRDASIIVFRKHLGAWSLFEGSDIDLDSAIEDSAAKLDPGIGALRPYLPELKPVVAKRHFFKTGNLRWFDFRILTSSELDSDLNGHLEDVGQSGSIILVFEGEIRDRASFDTALRRKARRLSESGEVVLVGGVDADGPLAWALRYVAAIERIEALLPEIKGDPVARRELSGRRQASIYRLHKAFEDTVADTTWISMWGGRALKLQGSLSRVASTVSDAAYSGSPIIHNELINRDRPSSNAVSARRTLLYRMISNFEERDLGIEDFPAELGLYKSVIESSGLHYAINNSDQRGFSRPSGEAKNGRSLSALWSDFQKFLALSEVERQSFAELYARWRRPPFGLRHGVMPILAMAFILALQDRIALYTDGRFTPVLDDLFVDRMLQDPCEVSLQQFRIEGVRKDVLHEIGSVVAGSLTKEKLDSPLDVAKPLAKFAHRLPTWVKRTKRLKSDTQMIRDILVNANDPNVLLFIDLPRACGLEVSENSSPDESAITQITEQLRLAISDLSSAYDRMLEELGETLAHALKLNSITSREIAELSGRAEKIVGISGDFRVDAFARRLVSEKPRNEWMEGIGGLAANKPVRDWTDADLDRAKIEIVNLVRRFQRIERVIVTSRGEPNAIQLNGILSVGETAKSVDFALGVEPKQAARLDALVEQIAALLEDEGDSRLRLAALTRILHDAAFEIEEPEDMDAEVN